ncbi:MAG TPA: hypothetical protein DFS52_21745 [Myxococcales bacterium]|nr:hypothetical protein [Myxococcales bacterium]
MRRCPSCRSEMNLVEARKLELDACPKCGGFWFDGGELEPVAGGQAVRSLAESARRGAAQCKSCGQELGPRHHECVKCGSPAPLCPECGDVLRVGNLRGVSLDVCLRCSGVYLDRGELQVVATNLGLAALLEEAGSQARSAASGSGGRVECETCHRPLRRGQVFDLGNHLYCGSCAPAGATPLDVKPSTRSPLDSNWDTYGSSSSLFRRGNQRVRISTDVAYGDDDPLEGALVKLFSWLFG